MENPKVAIIVGASYGIGRAVAVGLARHGYDTVLVARGKEGLDETATAVTSAGRRALVIQANIASMEDIDRVFDAVSEQYKAVNFLWNGASPFSESGLDDIELDVIRDLADTTFFGTLALTKKLLPLMKAADECRVVNVASDWALPGARGPSPFSAAKYALVGFTQGINTELITHNIYATTLYLGSVASQSSLDDPDEEIIDNFGASLIRLPDVINTVLFLCSLNSAYVPTITLLSTDPEAASLP